MTTEITLHEYAASEHKLSAGQLETLLQESKILHLSVEPIKSRKGSYILTSGSKVGALEYDGVSLLITPKIGISQLLSLACYAMGFYKPQDRNFDFKEAKELPDVLALSLTGAARRAFSRGLLHGYLTEEEALFTVRGRIQFSEQICRRFSIPLPVELRFDDFTEDILANRLVKAAAARLGRMTLRSADARRGLGWIATTLDNVSLREYRKERVPEVRFDRLNEHYRQVVGLARLILLHSEYESLRGDVRASGFLIDMNTLFQEFLTRALRESLGFSERTLHAEKGDWFDKGKSVWLKPDLSWWENSTTCTFVGDAKYKDLTTKPARHTDLYQLLAYVTTLNLPGGLLIYAQGGAGTTTYTVRHSGKRLEVFALDLSCSLDDILARIETLARKIRSLRAEALDLRASQNTTASQSSSVQPATQQGVPA